jgi:hypothetical protein
MQRYCSDAANIAQARRRTILTKSRTKIKGMQLRRRENYAILESPRNRALL